VSMTALALALVSALLEPTPPKSPESVRILSIELSADGGGGLIRTEAVRLSGADGSLQFGEGTCGKYPLADQVLAQLFSAMQAGHEIVFEADARGEDRCVRRVRFLGPRSSR